MSAWVHLLIRLFRGPYHKTSPFAQVPAEEPAADPTLDNARRLGQLLQLPQPDSVDGVPVWARLADFAPHWRSLLGSCRATNTVVDGLGITFPSVHQLPGQDLQQAVDALLVKGAIERVSNVTSLGFYIRLFRVPKKKTGDLRPVIDLSTLN